MLKVSLKKLAYCVILLYVVTVFGTERSYTPISQRENIEILLKKAKALKRTKNYDAALGEYNKALKIAKNNNLTNEAGNIYLQIGLTFYRQNLYTDAKEYFEKSILTDATSQHAADAYFNICLISKKESNSSDHFLQLQKALDIYKHLPDSKAKFNTYAKAGILFKNDGKYDIAIQYLLKSYKGFDLIQELSGKAYASSILASAQREQNNFEIAKKYQFEALHLYSSLQDTLQVSFTLTKVANLYTNLKKHDSAIVYYTKALQLQEQLPNKREIGKIVNNLAGAYYESKEYPKAIKYYKNALAIKKSEKDTLSMPNTYNELALISLKQNRLDDAKKYLDSSSFYVNTTQNKDAILRNHELKSAYYQIKKNYKKALDFRNKYIDLYKIIFNEKQTQIVQEMQERFESQQKQEKISELSVSNQQNINIIGNQKRDLEVKNLVIIICIFLILLGILFYFYLKQLQKAKERKLEMKRLASIYQGQEVIKENISRDLHDIITTSYDGIRLKILALSNSKKPKVIGETIIKEIKKINQEIRLISHRLSPLGNKIHTTSLREIITSQLSEFQYYRKIFVNVQLPLPDELDEMQLTAQTNFYGIILEILSNVERHSEATQIDIKHEKLFDKYLQFVIQDNGIGFNINNEKEGIGLLNIKQRVQLLLGKFTLKSSHTGTSIAVKFPLKENML